ncbi:hypothetical protein LWI29_017907 [Acer saccharum]|uniref:Uncharacterized protein n=1 Tax=Acer saccharum TaxID=4024 RepID=A0AA39SCP2_ACESA|nr:hypothetical protein LWI29_017907 [Acer saccharum]
MLYTGERDKGGRTLPSRRRRHTIPSVRVAVVTPSLRFEFECFVVVLFEYCLPSRRRRRCNQRGGKARSRNNSYNRGRGRTNNSRPACQVCGKIKEEESDRNYRRDRENDQRREDKREDGKGFVDSKDKSDVQLKK